MMCWRFWGLLHLNLGGGNSMIFGIFPPIYLGKIPILTNIFQGGLKPPTRNSSKKYNMNWMWSQWFALRRGASPGGTIGTKRPPGLWSFYNSSTTLETNMTLEPPPPFHPFIFNRKYISSSNAGFSIVMLVFGGVEIHVRFWYLSIAISMPSAHIRFPCKFDSMIDSSLVITGSNKPKEKRHVMPWYLGGWFQTWLLEMIQFAIQTGFKTPSSNT